MGRRQFLMVLRAASVLLVVVAIVAQAVVLANEGAFNATRFFAYFTIQSNLIGVATFALLLAKRDEVRSRRLELLRGAAVVHLMIIRIHSSTPRMAATAAWR